MNRLKDFGSGVGRILRGVVQRRQTLAAWIAGVTLVVGLTAMPLGSPLFTLAAHAQPQPPAPAIKWADLTWAIAPAGPGQWAVMLSMTYDKDGSVVLPVGVIAGVEKDVLTTANPPPTQYLGFTNTSIVQSKLEGTLFISAGLIAALGLDPSYDGSMTSVRWNYNHPTEGAAYVQVGSEIGSKWEPVLAKIRNHYQATINPAQLPEWDTTTTYLVDKHDEPGRVKTRPGIGVRWAWWRIIPAVAPFFWDLIRPSAVPVPTPPAPAQAPGVPQDIANCRTAVSTAADFFTGQCAASPCPPAQRQACVTCVQTARLLQFSNCDRNQPVNQADMQACTNISCN